MSELIDRISRVFRANVDPDDVLAKQAGQKIAPVGTPDNPSHKLLTVANAITVCRFLLTMAFLVLYIDESTRRIALICYITAAVTDYLDGWVARATQTVSWFGKVSDPLMDRVLLFTGVIGLVLIGSLPWWVAVFVIGRDLVLLGGNIYLRKFYRRPVDVLFIGKLSTALFMTGFCFLLVGLAVVPTPALINASWLPGLNGQPASIGIYMVYLAIFFSTLTAVIYYHNGFALRDEIIARGEVPAKKGR